MKSSLQERGDAAQPLRSGGLPAPGTRPRNGGNTRDQRSGRTPLGPLTNSGWSDASAKRQKTEPPLASPQIATPALPSPVLPSQPTSYPAGPASFPAGPASRHALLSAPPRVSDLAASFRPGIDYPASPPRSAPRSAPPNPIFWDLGSVIHPAEKHAALVNTVGAAVTEMFTQHHPSKTVVAGKGVRKEQGANQFSLHEVAAHLAGKLSRDPASRRFDIPLTRVEEVRVRQWLSSSHKP